MKNIALLIAALFLLSFAANVSAAGQSDILKDKTKTECGADKDPDKK